MASETPSPTAGRRLRVLLIAGSNRRQYNCPGVDSKARSLMNRLADRLPATWDVDTVDLGNVYGRARIQTCNACVSTSMALCVWPCNCYEKNSHLEPDLLWNLDLYSRLDQADAWCIIGPVNWYGPSSVLKQLFDRLVCMNGGNPKEELIDHKDPEKAMQLEKQPEWQELSLNHLEGRSAAFFCYGDGGGDELDETGRPKILRHKHYFDPSQEPFQHMRDAYAPLVWQCRYGGVEVPDQLWQYAETGYGKKYSDDQAEDMVQDEQFMAQFDQWTVAIRDFVEAKGPVTPGRFRAYGYEAPRHTWADIKLGWRTAQMALGMAPEGSSPRIQQEMGLNQDTPLRPDLE
ncbi:hypothetical protein GCM10023185_31190 [Hymenobacter saemangeumensis]|uniref:NADPH-dependent FMN reductase-like domain-containing protein n=1 Tax=Hymenobacter saemangeumensis TaxID=1084522 RepID=A0ABP8IML4_9BACT